MNDILVIEYNKNGADDEAAVHKVLQRCEGSQLKINKEKCHSRCTSIPFFWGGDIEKRSTTGPSNNQSPHRHASTKHQKGSPGLPWYY